jgi:Protein of unknown function (DUF3626)
MTASSLGPAQRRAVDHVASLSTGRPLDPGLRVTMSFHPDRWVAGTPLLALMARDGTYRSQFATGASNGGLTAHPGGDRWVWESRMFGGAYDDAPPSERPTYGALNHRRRSVGGSPRFGSAHFRLTADVLPRTTFCYPDSVFDPVDFGVAERCSLLDLAARDVVVDPLDDYVEAQVHGPVVLTEHVEALVLDPCHRGSEVDRLAHALPFPVEWHEGFRVSVAVLQQHPDYRGQAYVDLATRLARGGTLDPRVIGEAVRAGRHDQQALKRVWHYLARFGAPDRSTR